MNQNFILATLVVMLSFTWLPIAQGQYSDAFRFGSEATADLTRLHAMAEKGDPEAQYELAERYRIGFSIERNYKKALALYKRSAEQGFASSQFRLGELYVEGEILERDLSKAAELYRKAAKQGHVGGQYALAYSYHVGSGVEEDIAAAIVWYRKAALQGDEWAQLSLGDQYRIGIAVPKDLVQSTKWYRMAAEQGNIFAQYELGNAYRYGNGVEPNFEQSIKWYRLSAEAGNSSARLVLVDLEAGGIESEHITASAPAPDVSRVSSVGLLTYGSEANLIPSQTSIPTVGEEEAATPSSEPEDVVQNAISAPEGEAAAPAIELAYAAAPSHHGELVVSRLLARAKGQVAKLALTTPEGDNAYETYQQILSIQPRNEVALDGIEQIGVKYVELAKIAAGKGNSRRANHYAAKAGILAPKHPLVQSMTNTMEADQPTTEETTLTTGSLTDIKAQQRAQTEWQEVTAEAQMATTPPTSATLQNLTQDPDDLVFRPFKYEGGEVVVTGSVVHIFRNYRLKAETGQNSIVIDVDGLSQADRAKLDAAIERVGFLGQVQARIKGRIERQMLSTFHLVASELAVMGIGPGEDEILNPSLR